ncbi:MAG: phosphoribosylformylglycinamidine synthase, partial [Motiliproteus sp.]|nr:phosphoribosylformylglycinamidine synthase [Motiliproteus sp.]
MLTLRGAPALSAFRRQKLLAALQEKVPVVSAVYAEFTHFAELNSELDEQAQGVLEAILRYGPKADAETPAGRLYLVVPRPGTISPWSSKATDIAHNCGLAQIQRLERGTSYYIASSASLSDADSAAVEAVLH